jgi:uncharacterized protein
MESLVMWFEIPVSNISKAASFYQEVFPNIKFDFADLTGKPHAIFKSVIGSTQLKLTGALVEHRDKPEHVYGPVIFFNGNLGMNQTLSRIKEHGGSVVQEKTLIKNIDDDGTVVIPKTLIDGNYGYFAYFKDPDGNKMGLYSNF